MRCPKCGYISFDYQEICKKCSKNIGDTMTEVNGTVYNAEAPLFLQFESKKHFHVPPDLDQKMEPADSEPEIAVREGIDTDFVLGDEKIALDEGSEELVVTLDDFSAVAPREEFTLDLEQNRSEPETDLPSLDFGDLDISDLAPPQEEKPAPLLFEEEIKLAETEPIATLSEELPALEKPSATKSAGLEDLNVTGLNLDSPVKFVPSDKRSFSSVKTGTALDKFDVDLGELFPQNKK